MSRSSPWRRALTALIGCWYTLASVEPVPLHPCAMHEGAAVAATQTAVQQSVRALLTGNSAAPAAPPAAEHAHHARHAGQAASAPLAARSHGASPAPTAHTATGDHAAHGGAAPATEHAPPGGEHAHDGCLCIGGCTGAPPAVATPAAPLAWLATILPLAPSLDAPGALRRPAARVDVALPFPVGPPHTA